MKTNDLRIAYDIDGVPKGSNCAVIIRHADRGGPLNQVVRTDEKLNELGIRRSERFGYLLERFTELRSFSSPVDRCKETCKNISLGYGGFLEPSITELLGMSAPFMVDPKRAYDKMKEVGLLGFVDLYVKDSLDRSIVLPCSEGAKMLFSYAIENIRPMREALACSLRTIWSSRHPWPTIWIRLQGSGPSTLLGRHGPLHRRGHVHRKVRRKGNIGQRYWSPDGQMIRVWPSIHSGPWYAC